MQALMQHGFVDPANFLFICVSTQILQTSAEDFHVLFLTVCRNCTKAYWPNALLSKIFRENLSITLSNLTDRQTRGKNVLPSAEAIITGVSLFYMVATKKEKKIPRVFQAFPEP